MVSVQSGGSVVTIGDSSLPGVNERTTWNIPVADPGLSLSSYNLGGVDPLRMWKTQPSLRKVVGFVARNRAIVPWHAYERHSDGDRERRSDSAVERTLKKPQRFVTGYKLWHDLTIDRCLYDISCAVLWGGKLRRVSPRLLRVDADMFGVIERVGVNTPDGTIEITDLPLAIETGWSPTGATGVSPLITLQALLDEQTNAVEWRRAQWKRSPKLSGVLRRPIEAKWKDDKTRDRFLESWKSWRDTNAGGTPILEDGMEYQVLDTIKPIDARDIEGRQLTDAEVASAYFVAPELVGARQGTFSNIDAFRTMLYGPTLGPVLEESQQTVNAEIVPALAENENIYAELDREAALNGSFLEQAKILSTSVGGPWMTRSEARRRMNLTHIDGTDELITPLNVTEGGLASPQDTAPDSSEGVPA